jgi:hypothetical protein
MGIEPTRDLLGPALVLKTRSTTRHQSPPRSSSIILPPTIVISSLHQVNEEQFSLAPGPVPGVIGFVWLCFDIPARRAFSSQPFVQTDLNLILHPRQIGFVLKKRGRFVEDPLQLSNKLAAMLKHPLGADFALCYHLSSVS